MEYAFSILLFAFAAMLLLYAALLFLTKDVQLIPRTRMARIGNSRAYAAQFAKGIALIATAPILAGLAGLLDKSGVFTVIVLLCGVIGGIYLTARMVRNI